MYVLTVLSNIVAYIDLLFQFIDLAISSASVTL